MSESLKYIGSLYGVAALSTPGELITKRIDGARAALESVETLQAIQLATLAFDLPVDGDLEWLLEPLRNADPTFVPEPADRELSLLATGLLRAVLADGHKSVLTAALAVICCSMGGTRRIDPDGGVYERAVLALQTEQQKSAAKLPTNAALKNIDAAPHADAIHSAGDLNDITRLAHAVEKAIPKVVNSLQGNERRLRNGLNNLITYVVQQNEQMQQQWWLFGGWSTSANRPFRDLPIPEAALRAGVELAALTQLPAGPMSAPAILDKLLSDAKHNPEIDVPIATAVETADREWRRQWTTNVADTSVSLLCPVTLAASFALESMDEKDWRLRFRRESGLDATVQLPARGLAEQVLREQLLVRLWQST